MKVFGVWLAPHFLVGIRGDLNLIIQDTIQLPRCLRFFLPSLLESGVIRPPAPLHIFEEFFRADFIPRVEIRKMMDVIISKLVPHFSSRNVCLIFLHFFKTSEYEQFLYRSESCWKLVSSSFLLAPKISKASNVLI